MYNEKNKFLGEIKMQKNELKLLREHRKTKLSGLKTILENHKVDFDPVIYDILESTLSRLEKINSNDPFELREIVMFADSILYIRQKTDLEGASEMVDHLLDAIKNNPLITPKESSFVDSFVSLFYTPLTLSSVLLQFKTQVNDQLDELLHQNDNTSVKSARNT